VSDATAPVTTPRSGRSAQALVLNKTVTWVGSRQLSVAALSAKSTGTVTKIARERFTVLIVAQPRRHSQNDIKRPVFLTKCRFP
jgi:hypothetical protein